MRKIINVVIAVVLVEYSKPQIGRIARKMTLHNRRCNIWWTDGIESEREIGVSTRPPTHAHEKDEIKCFPAELCLSDNNYNNIKPLDFSSIPPKLRPKTATRIPEWCWSRSRYTHILCICSIFNYGHKIENRSILYYISKLCNCRLFAWILMFRRWRTIDRFWKIVIEHEYRRIGPRMRQMMNMICANDSNEWPLLCVHSTSQRPDVPMSKGSDAADWHQLTDNKSWRLQQDAVVADSKTAGNLVNACACIEIINRIGFNI